MKKLLVGSLSILLMSTAIVPAVKAQMEDSETEYPTEANQTSSSSSSMDMYDIRRTEAFNLVSSAYRGEFEDYGIPSYAELSTEYQSGQITPEQVVEAAVEAGELSPKAQQDEDYLNAVELQLEGLSPAGR